MVQVWVLLINLFFVGFGSICSLIIDKAVLTHPTDPSKVVNIFSTMHMDDTFKSRTLEQWDVFKASLESLSENKKCLIINECLPFLESVKLDPDRWDQDIFLYQISLLKNTLKKSSVVFENSEMRFYGNYLLSLDNADDLIRIIQNSKEIAETYVAIYNRIDWPFELTEKMSNKLSNPDLNTVFDLLLCSIELVKRHISSIPELQKECIQSQVQKLESDYTEIKKAFNATFELQELQIPILELIPQLCKKVSENVESNQEAAEKDMSKFKLCNFFYQTGRTSALPISFVQLLDLEMLYKLYTHTAETSVITTGALHGDNIIKTLKALGWGVVRDTTILQTSEDSTKYTIVKAAECGIQLHNEQQNNQGDHINNAGSAHQLHE